MIKDVAERVERVSPNIVTEQIEELKSIFPEAFTEEKIDFDKLKTALGDIVDTQPEKYSFTWAGKRDAIQLLQTPSSATLVPAEDESIDFDTTQNLFLEGDNLEVLKLLYKSYFGRIKMVYVDPPYNTGNDFVYPDDFTHPLDTYLKITGQKDTNGNLLTSNPERSGRFHSAWLSMMYPRLFIARQLLQEDGLIFVSIDDNEVFNLRLLMNEVFGEENFVDTIIWKKRYGGGAKEKYLVSLHEYVVCYAKNLDLLDEIFIPPDPDAIEKYYKYKDEKFEKRGPYRTHPLEATKSVGVRKNLVYPIPLPEGGEVWPKRQWWWEKDRTMRALENNELEFLRNGNEVSVHTKQYWKDENGKERPRKAFSIIDGVYTQHGTAEIEELFGNSQVFPFPKPTGLIKQLLLLSKFEDGDIALDLFAGSCSTAQAVLRLNREDNGNRRFIMVQLPEQTDNPELPTIAEIGKDRIRRVIKKITQEDRDKLKLSTRAKPEDLGFRVFKLAPSNYKQWKNMGESDPDAYIAQLSFFTDPLRENWTPENVLWEVAIKEGYGLNAHIKQLEELQENTVWQVTDPDKDQSLLLCLDDELKPATLSALPLTREHIFVCRNKALDDTKAANLALQCRLKKI